MRAVKHICIVCLLFLTALSGYAQVAKYEKALEFYRAKQLDSAKVYIDAAAENPETNKEFNTWMVRGFIYKDLYKAKESNNPKSLLRDVAVESFRRSLALDTLNKNPQKTGILQSLKYQAASYHNDIVKTLDSINYQQSIKNAEKYKELTKFLDPSFNEKNYDYEVYLNIGSMFEREYEKNDSKNALDLSKVYLFKAYEIFNNKFSVNKNIGLLYYNQAVTIIKKMDYDIPLDQLPIYQDQSVKLAKQSEPYLLKAHELEPNDRAVIEALAGVYYLLNENDKHNEYKKKLEALNKQ